VSIGRDSPSASGGSFCSVSSLIVAGKCDSAIVVGSVTSTNWASLLAVGALGGFPVIVKGGQYLLGTAVLSLQGRSSSPRVTILLVVTYLGVGGSSESSSSQVSGQ
jgi:hypothetical protein